MYNNKVVDEEPNAMEKKRPKKKQDKDLEKLWRKNDPRRNKIRI